MLKVLVLGSAAGGGSPQWNCNSNVSKLVREGADGTTPRTQSSIAVTANRFLRLDIAPNETTFFESTYPIVMTHHDSLSVEVGAPDSGGTGIGSAVNFIVNGDTDV